MKPTKIARVNFVLILLELFLGSHSFKASPPRDAADQTLPPSRALALERGGRKAKTCFGIHSIVRNASLAAVNAKAAERGTLLESQQKNIALSSPIPKVIHVTFATIEDIPACVPQSFSAMNPGYAIQMWGDAEIIEFLKSNFSEEHA